jgi:hypothetical protein
MPKMAKRAVAALAGVLTLWLACVMIAGAAEAAPPVTVPIPSGGNYGGTSFYDAYGRTTPGFSVLEDFSYQNVTELTNYQGHKNTYFSGPHLQVFSSSTEFSYTSGWHPFGGDDVGFSVTVPLVSLNSHFAADSRGRLSNNDFNLGDLRWGPIYHTKIYRTAQGRPELALRFQLSIASPTGAFNKSRNMNQGCGYWAISPNIAATYMPVAGLEISTRLNYEYNFATSDIASPPRVPGLVYHNGQAGQTVFGNFAASYKVAPRFELGFNGYFIDQLTPDKTNGQIVPHSRQTAVYIGPGARYVWNKTNSVNLNLYVSVESHNGSAGTKLNIQYVHRF